MTRTLPMLLALLLAAVCLAEEQTEQPPRKHFDSAKWRETIDAFKAKDAESPPPENAVLFVGSSTIRNWDTAADFPSLTTINRGFGGSRIPNVLHYMDEIVIPYKPRIVVFYCGDNDINAGQPPVHVAADFQQFAQRTLDALPNTRIVLLAIKPSVNRQDKWPLMADANQRCADFCATDDRLVYLDLADTVLDEAGNPDPAAFTDGLHLSRPVYEVWAQRVTAAIAAIDAAAREADTND